jgi:chromosome partitioning protein
MPKVISFVNLKGGVGKTTIAVNFADYCGRKGLKTLLVDTDPQTNATFSCITVEEWVKHSKEKGTISNIMGMRRQANPQGKDVDVSEIIIKNVFNNVDLIPSHLDLFTIDLDLAGVTAREKKLKRSLDEILENYQVVVCDCPPNLTIPTQNSLAMSTHFAVPVSPDYLSALGVGILLSRITEFCKDIDDHEIKHVGIIMSRVGRKSIHREAITRDLRNRFKNLVIKTEIHERTSVSEAASKNLSIFDMNDKQAKIEFEGTCKVILKRMEL